MLTGNPADGATTVKSGFEEVMPFTTQIAALVLQTFNVPVALGPAHAGVKNGGDGTWISGIATFRE